MELVRHFTTIDAHTGGEPLRIITGGLPQLKGKTLMERRAYFRDHHDEIRKLLMFEPRGHHGMYGCVVTDPVSPEADFGVLFMHNEGFSTMCGHGIIAVVTALLETGQLDFPATDRELLIDSPAGLVKARAVTKDSEVESVSFENVPSFLFRADFPIHLPDFGEVFVDIAFGGAFYAIVDASRFGLDVTIADLPRLQTLQAQLIREIEANVDVVHPLDPNLKGIYGVIFSAEPRKPSSNLRNVTVFADQQIDRSPCGTGTAARLAGLYQRRQWPLEKAFVHESIIGSQFTGRILAETKVGDYPAVLPEITGNAFITGFHNFVVDPSDPLKAGFLLG